MAAEVDQLILAKTGSDINLSANHIKCFCHKVALILNAGLKAISVGNNGLVKSKKATLGFVPGLVSTTEEFKVPDNPDTFKEEGTVEDPETPYKSSNCGSNSDPENKENHIPSGPKLSQQSKGPNIGTILKKVDFVIQKITASAAKQSEFNTWSKKLDYTGPSLIAGYGIQWNIKFQRGN
ncbi:hypothetical protein PCANC_12883 [Puccinia coronata f. sp. avenae]|uniref:Uncharacterized protein n=1 Tax=Puccinia coronata f. sp. avenae TaxID=200324 RepID=A0A2N5VE53_9BASI|nr:hypothetical protein PCANC_12883 [Puccinia coronata f. sp. avenae]